MYSKVIAIFFIFMILMVMSLPPIYASVSSMPPLPLPHPPPHHRPSTHNRKIPNPPSTKHPTQYGGYGRPEGSPPVIIGPPATNHPVLELFITNPPVTIPPSYYYPPYTGGGGGGGGRGGGGGGSGGRGGRDGGGGGGGGSSPGGGGDISPGGGGSSPAGGEDCPPGGGGSPPGGGGGGTPAPNPPPPGGGGGGDSPPGGGGSPPGGGGGGTPAPNPPPLQPTCPINALNLGLCLDLFGGMVRIRLGSAIESACCPMLQGMIDMEAAVCLCSIIRFKIFNMDMAIPLALQTLFLCGKTPPPGFVCPPL